MTLLVRVIIVISIGSLIRTSAAKDTIHIGVIIPVNSEIIDFSAYIPTLELALETIENDTTLPFNFAITFNDSMCKASSAVLSFLDQVLSSATERPILLIGAGCSIATEAIAELTPHWNIVQISPASSSPRLSDAKSFPRFLRTVSSDAEIVVGIVQAMKLFGWSEISVITQSEILFTLISLRLKEELAASNLQLIREFTFNTEGNVTYAVESLNNSPTGVVFLNMYSDHATEVLCEAYKNKMFYPTYIWIFYNWYLDNWWVYDAKWSNCVRESSVQVEDLEMVVRNSLSLDYYPRIKDERADERNVGNITWNQFVSEHKRRFMYNNSNEVIRNASAYLFDAIWTAALALNRTAARLKRVNLSLMDFDYEDVYGISDIIYDEARKAEFFGLTGNVYFFSNGDRPGQIQLLQYRDAANFDGLEKVQVAKLINGEFVYNSGENDSTVYAGALPPENEDMEHIYISFPLFIVYTIIAVIGMIFAIVCLIINLWPRNQKSIPFCRLMKFDGHYVNIMIVAGAVVLYVTVILFGVDENVASYSTVDGLCHARIWVAAIGYSLLYGTIFAKTWRMYPTFEVKDLYLCGVVGTFVAADIIFTISTTNSRLRREYEETDYKVNESPQIIGVCTSECSSTWLPILFAYKGFVLLAGLLAGVLVAFKSCIVKTKPLNESCFVTVMVYVAMVVSIIVVTLIGLVLQHYPNVQYGIIGIVILLSTSLILGLIFIPKWYKLYKDSAGDHTIVTNFNMTDTVVGDADENYYKRKILSLNEEITTLKSTITTLNDKLAKMAEIKQ